MFEPESHTTAPKPEDGQSQKCGFVAIVGRPNAGKSTLLNRLAGEKIAAVSNKPQTTRYQIRAIVNRPQGQIVLVDTPGIHQPGYLLNRRMMSAVSDALASVDVLLLIRDASTPTGNGDRFALELVIRSGKPCILLLNKIDKLPDKAHLLPLIEWYGSRHEWRAVVPVSARKGDMLELLVAETIKNLPSGSPAFPEDELTDQPLRNIVSEMVREKILMSAGEEIPYVTAVMTERFDETDPEMTRIHCAIFVERSSQKKIIIGKEGEKLKEIGSRARQDIERLLGRSVYLELFVKVERNWRNSEHALRELGI